jgi:hypothetical protein
VFKLTRFESLLLLLNAGFWFWFWRAVFNLHLFEPQLDAAPFVAFNHRESFPSSDFFRSINIGAMLNLPAAIVIRVVALLVPSAIVNAVPGFNNLGLRVAWLTVLSFVQWFWFARGLEWIWVRIRPQK